MTYANSAIQPDMTNYYRLLREQQRKSKLSRDFPELERHFKAVCEKPLIHSFCQALPTKGINPDPDPNSLITSRKMPRGIEITNSINERTILMRRFLMAALDESPEAKQDWVLCRQDLDKVTDHFGLGHYNGNEIESVISDYAAHMRRVGTLRLIQN